MIKFYRYSRLSRRLLEIKRAITVGDRNLDPVFEAQVVCVHNPLFTHPMFPTLYLRIRILPALLIRQSKQSDN